MERTIKTSVRNIPHRVLDSPIDTVHEQLELWRWEVKKRCKKLRSGFRKCY